MYTILEESSTKVAKSSTKVAKINNHYNCELCDYSSSRKCNIKKHLATQKHKKNAVNYTSFCNSSDQLNRS